MEKKPVRRSGRALISWIGLMAVVCVPSFIAGAAYTKPAMPITLLNATTTGPESNVLSLSNTANPNAAPDRAEQPTSGESCECK